MKKQFKLIVLIVGAIGAMVLLFFIGSLVFIQHDVKQICAEAKQAYQLDCVDSLVSYASSEEHSYRKRNKAIWALGQIADRDAVPFLMSLSRQVEKKKRYDLNEELSAYEINKALRWCTQGSSVSWMYLNRNQW